MHPNLSTNICHRMLTSEFSIELIVQREVKTQIKTEAIILYCFKKKGIITVFDIELFFVTCRPKIGEYHKNLNYLKCLKNIEPHFKDVK